MEEFEKALKYFYDNGYEIIVENKTFINFANKILNENGFYNFNGYYFDIENNTFVFDDVEVGLEAAFYSSILIMGLYNDDDGDEGPADIDRFLKRCNEIFPGYVKEAEEKYMFKTY